MGKPRTWSRRQAESYAEERMRPAVLAAAEEVGAREIKAKKEELVFRKMLTKGAKVLNKVESFLGKRTLKRARPMTKKMPRGTVVLNQPVYIEDSPRYFKEAVDEERRQLFFK